MGSEAFFVTFKSKSKEDVLDALSEIKNYGGNDGQYSVSQIVTINKSNFESGLKKGCTYAMTYGCRYAHRDKTFVEGSKTLNKNNTRVILGSKFYNSVFVSHQNGSLEDIGDIETIEYIDGKYRLIELTEKDKRLEEEFDIHRVPGGYDVPVERLNIDDLSGFEGVNAMKYSEGDSYYEIDIDDINDGDKLMLTGLENKDYNCYKSSLWINNMTGEGYGYFYFEERFYLEEDRLVIDEDEYRAIESREYISTKDIEQDMELVRGAMLGVALKLKKESLKNVEIVYFVNMSLDEFSKYEEKNIKKAKYEN